MRIRCLPLDGDWLPEADYSQMRDSLDSFDRRRYPVHEHWCSVLVTGAVGNQVWLVSAVDHGGCDCSWSGVRIIDVFSRGIKSACFYVFLLTGRPYSSCEIVC